MKIQKNGRAFATFAQSEPPAKGVCVCRQWRRDVNLPPQVGPLEQRDTIKTLFKANAKLKEVSAVCILRGWRSNTHCFTGRRVVPCLLQMVGYLERVRQL